MGQYFVRYYSNVNSDKNDILELKLKMIQAEYDLLKHTSPDKVPSNLSELNLEYLSILTKFKKIKKKLCIDLAFNQRLQVFERLKNLETFNGNDELFLPMIGSEVRFIFFLLLFQFI